jgi:hypothetical protein
VHHVGFIILIWYIYTHTYIPWIHNCVTKTVGYGTSHKHTKRHNFYSVKYFLCSRKKLYYTHNKFTYRVYGVCIYVLSYGCLKLRLVTIADCQIMWQTVENFDTSIQSTIVKTTRSMMMVLIPCINIVYRLICLKYFLIIHNEVH